VARFFELVDAPHPFKVGMDSCTVPGAIRNCRTILHESLDTCEGGRFSCYIGPDMVMVPCSFDQERRYEVQLRGEGGTTIEDAWNSAPFEAFRDRMRGACPGCGMWELCMGGCPLMPQVVLCDSGDRKGWGGE
jgi:radical SAM protein with 4Fe4S-binding SPASM domain